MDAIYSIIGFFASGGAFMYPILLVFAVGSAIAIERFITLSAVTHKNDAAWKSLQPWAFQSFSPASSRFRSGHHCQSWWWTGRPFGEALQKWRWATRLVRLS